MKLALALVLLLGCGSSAKSSATTPSGGGGSSPTGTTPGTTAPPTGGGATGGGATGGGATGQGAPKVAAAPYSCFSYASKNSAAKRHACARTDDCASYLDQAKTVPGLKDFTGCESVGAVFCFHQAPSKDDPEGQDICQPTLDDCKLGRADVVKAKMAVDSDCAQR